MLEELARGWVLQIKADWEKYELLQSARLYFAGLRGCRAERREKAAVEAWRRSVESDRKTALGGINEPLNQEPN